ncbi:uncharacterized protein LOC135939875 [Cloeon dipterum]|uniref:uncharacterized protein LOC135939875 n=1 Tax=Cloeon dipterum TaxID=197152 RepID=UPI0032202A9C
MSFEEVILVDAPVVLDQFSVDDENIINGNSDAIDPIQISVSSEKQTQEFNCSSEPMVLDVDLNSIMQNGSSGKQKTKEGNKIKKNSPKKNCSKFPRKLKNNMIQLMQEKLRRTLEERKEKNKPEEKKIVEQTPAPSAKDYLLCKDCNTHFSTSVAKSKHRCNSGKKYGVCRKCSNPYLGPDTMDICFKCWRDEKYRKIALSRNCPTIFESNSSTDSAEETAELRGKIPEETYKKRPPKPAVSKLREEDELACCVDNTSKESLPAKEKIKELNLENSPAIETTSEFRFTCSFCPENFGSRNMLSRHSGLEHLEFHFCDFCLLNLKSDLQLEVHKLECERKKLTKQQCQSKQTLFDFNSLSCRLCNLEFQTELNLVDHAFANHGNFRGGVCCGKHFAMDELVKHKQLIHGAVSEVHSVIEIKLKERCKVLDAALKKLKSGNFQCSLCSYSAASLTALSEHRQNIHKDKA